MPENDLPIFVKWCEILKWVLKTTERFPKKVRFTFSTRIDNYALDILDNLIESIYTRNKLQRLSFCNTTIEKLRVLFRFCFELRYISQNQYEYISRQLNEAGAMIGGWIKSQKAL